MPFVDLHSKDDYASIYYITNSPYGNVGGFDSDKPTIIMLHPAYLDSTWLHHQFGDPRLDNNYNLIAFDMRVCGNSTCRPSGKHDAWVEAADLAFCVQALHLPPCHVLASETISVHCALRFAILFPDMCSSLTLCNVPAPNDHGWVFTAIDEVTQAWCYAEDLEGFEHSGMEAVRVIVGKDCDADLQDDLIAYWETHMPPTRRVRVVEQMGVIMNRVSLKPYMLKQITQPVLIIQGERNETCPVKYAEELAANLVNVENGAILYTVKGGSGALSIIPGTASIANQVFAKFISRLPHTRSDLVATSISTEERMSSALEKLSELTRDSSIASRDPMSSLSFSCLSPETVKGQTESLLSYRKGQSTAFCPIGPEGEPVRRFSERKKGHWFQGERDGLSYAGVSFLPHKQGKQDLEYEKQPPETNSNEITQQGRLRRVAATPSSIDKQVIKGPMAKVVSSSNPASLQRLLNKS